MDAQHPKHVSYKLAYHFVWCPKYRKKILVGRLATFIEQEIRRICETKNTWTIGALSVQEDHVHLFLNAPPSVAPSQIAHTLKGTTPAKCFNSSYHDPLFREARKYTTYLNRDKKIRH